MFAVSLVFALAPAVSAGAPVVEAAPNIYGQTGVVRTTSAETRGDMAFALGAQGFGAYQHDFIVGGKDDDNVLLGGNVFLSGAFFDLLEVSVASRAGSDANSKLAPAQFSVGDLYLSLKGGYPLGPVAVGADVRALLPTSIDSAGFDFGNFGVTAQGLVTADLHRSMDIPLRAHLNAGFVYQQGNQRGGTNFFEENPNFYSGVQGQLTALAADQWFYHQVIAGLSVEAPLPYATPFLETWYQTAIEVNDNRGAKGKPYDFLNDAHLTVTPGARFTVGGGITFDVAVDIGLTGGGKGGTDVNELVSGQPINPLWTARAGLTYTFDPVHGGAVVAGPAGGGSSSTGQVKGCVTDQRNNPIPDAIVTGDALAGARIATDQSGCFLTPPVATGDVQLTVEKEGFEHTTLSTSVGRGEVAEANAQLKATEGPQVVRSGGVARIVGWVTNKDDETIEADLELWDGTGVKPAGKSVGGAFDLQAQAGSVIVVAKADGYLAQGAAVVVDAGGHGRASIVLKKAGKSKKAALSHDKITVKGKVPFQFKKPRLQSTSEYVLDDVVDVMLRNPALKVRIDDYAEPLGSPEASQKLADERAAAVADYLIQHGVWPARLSTKGVAAASARNRRVDFVVLP